jgi:hypothetical protein
MYLNRVAVVRSGGTRINSVARWNFINLSSSARLKAKIHCNLNHFKSHFMYVRKRVICEWCRWNYKNLRSWTNFTASRSWKSFLTIVCRYRGRTVIISVTLCNVYAEKWVQFYGIFRWTRFLLTWLVKNRDRLWVASSTSKRHGFLQGQ